VVSGTTSASERQEQKERNVVGSGLQKVGGPGKARGGFPEREMFVGAVTGNYLCRTGGSRTREEGFQTQRVFC